MVSFVVILLVSITAIVTAIEELSVGRSGFPMHDVPLCTNLTGPWRDIGVYNPSKHNTTINQTGSALLSFAVYANGVGSVSGADIPKMVFTSPSGKSFTVSGTITTDCSGMKFSNGASWVRGSFPWVPPPPAPPTPPPTPGNSVQEFRSNDSCEKEALQGTWKYNTCGQIPPGVFPPNAPGTPASVLPTLSPNNMSVSFALFTNDVCAATPFHYLNVSLNVCMPTYDNTFSRFVGHDISR
eukprot:m.277091 g.277091  ORF g.277091 m.277091 type:complete len:240 (-) comp128478_c0_seq1:22-741(-)